MVRASIKTEGLNGAQAELRRMTKQMQVNSVEMMTVLLMSISANTKPYVPVDTSTLINSEKRTIRRSGNQHGRKIIGEISYGADGSVNPRGTPVQEYAAYVHEGAQKDWQKPGASNQYLTKGVRDTIRDDLSSIIARYT